MGVMKNLLFVPWLLVLACTAAHAQQTKTPTDIVRSAIDQVKQIIANEKEKTAPQELKTKLENTVFSVFDFKEMALSCLGANRQEATSEQLKEYVDLFSKLLSRSYYKKVIKHADKSTVTYKKETVITATKKGIKYKKAIVRTVFKLDGEKTNITFKLNNKSGQWKAYNIVVDDMSTLATFRGEHRKIFRKKGMDGLLKELREKVKKD